MIMTTKICTSIEQSKKLIELGLDINTADMHWQYVEEDSGQLQWFYFPKDFSINQEKSIPAWSLSALLELISTKNYSLRNSNVGTNKYNVWIPERKSPVWTSTPLDAVFETVFWLLENKKV